MEQENLLTLLKVIFMIGFVAIVLIVGSIPIRSKIFKTNKLLKTLGTTFAGALFLNVSILHILPQSADTIQKILQDGDDDKQVFPLANLFVISGFLITIFFTRIIATHSHQHQHQHEHQNSHNHNHNGNEQQTHKQSLISHNQGQNKENEDEKSSNEKPNDSYFLTVAMYFHTIFEGIAIGVQNTLAGFLSTAIAIAFHKWADALSMGIYYRNRKVKKQTAYGLIIGQAALNLIAIAFGWIIDSFGDFTQAIFLSISAGTFLAISTMQMLGESLNGKQYKIYKFLILLVSTGIICSVWFLQNEAFNTQ